MWLWMIVALGWVSVALIALSVFRLASLADRFVRKKSKRRVMELVAIERPPAGRDRAA
jgi:hypothetical protein